MRNRRTDLALEARELWQESAEERTQLEGVEAREEMREGIPVSASWTGGGRRPWGSLWGLM